MGDLAEMWFEELLVLQMVMLVAAMLESLVQQLESLGVSCWWLLLEQWVVPRIETRVVAS